jgi:hypothetical protein
MEAQLIDLYDALERQPSDVYIHEMLLKVWESLGEESNKASLIMTHEPQLTELCRHGNRNCLNSCSN